MNALSKALLIGFVSASLTGQLQAGEVTIRQYVAETEASFDDAVSDLRESIVNRGLVVDFTGHVGAMLSRTAQVTNSPSPYTHAQYMQFCSAKLTHAAVAASPENIAICPYVVFAYALKDTPGKVTLGYRRPKGMAGPASAAAIQEIDKLLREIVDAAAGD